MGRCSESKSDYRAICQRAHSIVVLTVAQAYRTISDIILTVTSGIIILDLMAMESEARYRDARSNLLGTDKTTIQDESNCKDYGTMAATVVHVNQGPIDPPLYSQCTRIEE